MTETIYKPPTDTGIFERRTSLMPEVIAEQFVAASGLSDAQVSWFVRHVDLRTRWLHANNPRWKRWLESEGNKGRDQLYVFAEHWASAYRKNPDMYEARMTDELNPDRAPKDPHEMTTYKLKRKDFAKQLNRTPQEWQEEADQIDVAQQIADDTCDSINRLGKHLKGQYAIKGVLEHVVAILQERI